MDVEGAPEGGRSRVGGGWWRRGGRLQKFKRHPAAALTPFSSAKRRIWIENKLLFFDKKNVVRRFNLHGLVWLTLFCKDSLYL